MSVLKNYIYWFLAFVVVCIYGITHVSAAEYFFTYDDVQIYYDNNGSLTRLGGTWNESLQAYVSPNFTTTAGSYGGFVLFNSPIPIIQNHTYTLVFNFEQRNNIALSSKSNLSIGRYQSDVINAYNNSSYNATSVQKNVLNNTIIQYVFKANVNAGYIGVPWTTLTTTNQNYVINSVSIEDLGSEGVSEQTINNSLTNQTNILNNSIQNSTNTITGALNNTEQNIIDNQNQNNNLIIENNNVNTDKIIDSINGQFQTCNENLITKFEIGTIASANGLNSNSSTRIRVVNFIPIELNKKYDITINNLSNYVLFKYDENYNFIERVVIDLQSFSYTETDNNVKFIKLIARYNDDRIINSNDLSSIKWFVGSDQVCTNKLDEQKDAIDNLNNSINNSDSTGATNDASNFFSNFNTNTYGLTSVITSPLSFIQGLSSKTCSPLSIPLPYVNKNLNLPCMSDIYSQYFGSFFTMYQTITFSIIAYWVCVRIFNLVKDFKNPDHDEIEVFDL